MAETDTRSTKQLFNDWRKGDGQAGQMMAQRFADWYYAITTSRLGESRGREPCDVACKRFGDGIVSVTDPRSLVPWAHEIVLKELEGAGTRATDGDEPNAYTGEKHPKDLLVRARGALPNEVKLLEASYSGRAPEAEVEAMAEQLGGNPIGILRARYRVKQWLRDQEGVPFEVAPEVPNIDLAPLPLYESGRMATPQEEINFEQWMINDIELCRDIAEFAHFALALRGGLPAGEARPGRGGRRDPEIEKFENRPGCLARLFGR
ncbi:MAG: hypothetical protein R3F59_38240 [Myxococcota bacterium]